VAFGSRPAKEDHARRLGHVFHLSDDPLEPAPVVDPLPVQLGLALIEPAVIGLAIAGASRSWFQHLWGGNTNTDREGCIYPYDPRGS